MQEDLENTIFFTTSEHQMCLLPGDSDIVMSPKEMKAKISMARTVSQGSDCISQFGLKTATSF